MSGTRRGSRDKKAAPDARERALRLLAGRERSRRELAERLQRLGCPDAEIAKALDELASDGYQSDQRYAEMLVRSRTGQGYGPIRMQSELRAAGIDDEIAAQVLAGMQVDWERLAADRLVRRYGDNPPADLAERARRARFLLRRGFDAATVGKVTRT